MSLEERSENVATNMQNRIASYDELQQKLCDIETRIAEYEITSFMACKKTIGALERKILDLETRLELERGTREVDESKLEVTETMLETMIQKKEEDRNNKVKLRLMLEKLEAQAEMFDVHMQKVKAEADIKTIENKMKKVRAESAINNITFNSEMADVRANDAKMQLLQAGVTEMNNQMDKQSDNQVDNKLDNKLDNQGSQSQHNGEEPQ